MTSSLERRYRRLLISFPANFRRKNEDELVGVLLDATEPGRDWPTLRDAIDLIRGGLRVRADRSWFSIKRGPWGDALAITSVLAPILLLAGGTPAAHEAGWFVWQDGPQVPLSVMLSLAGWMAWAPALALSLLGARRTGAAAAWLALLGLMALGNTDAGEHFDPGRVLAAWWLLLGLLAAVALTIRPGPRRGLALLGGKRFGVIVLAVSAVLFTGLLGHTFAALNTAAFWALLAAVIVILQPSTPAGRRLLPLLAMPLAAYFIATETHHMAISRTTGGGILAYTLPIIAFTLLLAGIHVGSKWRDASKQSANAD